jgi:hypothetical protein
MKRCTKSSTKSGQLTLQLMHLGHADFQRTDGTPITFLHQARETTAQYDIRSDTSSLGDFGNDDRKFIDLSPFAYWVLIADSNPNINTELKLAKVEEVTLVFSGQFADPQPGKTMV